MIKNVGYTQDGMVWVSVQFAHEGKAGELVVTMTQEQSRALSEGLVKSADMAFESVKTGVKDERNSANPH